MSRGVALAALAAMLALATEGSAMAQAVPYTSWRKLTSSNGFAPVVFDAEQRKIVSFRENLYRFPAPGAETRELAYDFYFGLRAGGTSRWLSEVPLVEAGYVVGSGLIRTVQDSGGLRVTTTYTAPYGIDARVFLAVIQVENTGPDVRDVAIFSLHNFHVGGGPDRTSGERVVWDAALGAYLETSNAPGAARGALVVKPLVPATAHTVTPANPYPLVGASQLFTNVDDSGVTDDAVSGFQLDVAGREVFPTGARAELAVAVGWAPDGNAAELVSRIDAFHAGRTPGELVDAEREGWAAWHRAGVWPRTASADELQVGLQSLAMLRMGQVREPGAPNGQIVASLAPGMWDIAWLRDGLLAVRAFTATGHHDEAQAALDFYMRGPAGDYESYVGRPYGLSITRYYGNGREESDSNERGPNIELDGFGMFLEAAAEHVAASGRTAWLERIGRHANDLVADVLVGARDPQTGLVMAESSIWESHWDDGGRQRWVYTSGYAVIGLRAWADVIESNGGDTARVEALRRAAGEILAGIRSHLVDPGTGALAASVEQLQAGDGRFADAQAALILGPRSIAPGDPTGLATLDFLRDRLFLSGTTRRGYKRNDDGGAYDEREWGVIDLGISRALRAAGRTAEADGLLAWITGQALRNFLLIPELFHQQDARYFGEVPMIGFGAGAYLLALIDRSGTVAPPNPIADAGVTSPDAAAESDAAADLDAGVADAGEPTAPDAAAGSDAGPAAVIDASQLAGDARATRNAARRTPAAGCGCSTQRNGAPGYAVFGWLALLWLGRKLACKPRARRVREA